MSADPAEPVVSVVVATYGRASRLATLVAALEAQTDCGPFEVVVVDDGSRDDTWAELKRLSADSQLTIRPYRIPTNRGPATARNVGWREANAPLVAFTDDDCTPQPGWLAAVVDGLARADIAQGMTVPDPGQEANRGPFSHTMHVKGENGYYATCNIGYRREVLEKVDGFAERFRHPYGEDIDLAWRAKEAGATTTFVRDAVVFHDIRPASFDAHVRDLRRRSGIVLLVAAHPGLRARFHRKLWVRPSHPPALLAGAGMLLALAGRSRAARIAGLALLAPYVRHHQRNPLPSRTESHLADLPLALASDLAEVGVLAAASARVGTVVL